MAPLLRSLLVLPFAFTTGCYSHIPTDLETVSPGTVIRARVSAAEAERLAPVLRRHDRVLGGTVVEHGPDGVLLDVASVVATEGLSPTRLNQRITLDQAQVHEVEIRRLDRLRTAGLVAGGIAAAVMLVSAAFGPESAPASSGDGKGGVDFSVGKILTGW
jgi:hypothetical protein